MLFCTVVSAKRILREPLLHFLAIGAGLFLAFAIGGDSGEPQKPHIDVRAEDIARLAEGWQRTWLRPPTDDELTGLIDDFVKEEVYYRQALEMRLDHDDTIVRRRLRQKLEFLSEDLIAAIEPSEDDLQEFLTRNPETFRIESRIALSHVFFSPERRGAGTAGDVRSALARLEGAERAAGDDLGDPLPLPVDFEAASARELQEMFGPQFASAVFRLEPGRWQGPIESAYGLHLVFVAEVEEGRLPTLDEVRDEVRREWLAERRVGATADFYRELRSRYDVSIEWPDLDPDRPASID